MIGGSNSQVSGIHHCCIIDGVRMEGGREGRERAKEWNSS